MGYFPREMDIDFISERDKFVVIYLHDLIVFSKSDAKHMIHLKQTFKKCRKFVLSLNPKKSHFSMKEGKLLGHIVSKEGIKVDPKRFEAIDTINIPSNRKEIQYSLGKIRFLRRFIPNFAEIIKLITAMLKKYNEVKWTAEAKASLERVNKAIGEAPMLASPDYTKELFIFSFAYEHIVATILLRNNEEGFEKLIAFFSKILRDGELKYDIL